MHHHVFGRFARTIFAGAALALSAACGGGDGSAALATASVGDDAQAGAASMSTKAAAEPGSTAAAVDLSGFESLRNVQPFPNPRGTETSKQGHVIDVTLDNFYVVDRKQAIRLGKALFWDMNLGSDGTTACASCHFQAGADNRTKNQLAPPLEHAEEAKRLFPTFTRPAGSPLWGPNHQLRKTDFPTHVLTDPLNRDSAIVSSTPDIVSSQGVFDRTFLAAGQSRFDDCRLLADPVFQVGGISTRRVPPRNSPTVINAALNVRNFWDGRANDIFNGFSPFGLRDPGASFSPDPRSMVGGIWVTTTPGGPAANVKIALRDASAASQAVGPPGSPIEMSCGGRTWPDIARRVLDTPALNRQAIAPDDSVLRDWAGGLKPKYRALVQAAFAPRLWDSKHPVDLGGVPYTQMEANFSLFFGLAIQLYESTLISDQAPLDAYLAGDKTALSSQQILGMQVFAGKGKCINCHNGPELTNAATRLRRSLKERVENMVMGDGQVAIYDAGFYNIGVRPTVEDLGVGGKDPWFNPLSFTRQYRAMLGGPGTALDPFSVDPCRFEVPLTDRSPCDSAAGPPADFRDAVDGAFKTPTLRNVALTGPYFHNGSRSTLEQVVEFYDRGGDRRGSKASNTTGFGPNGSNLDADIEPLGLTDEERKNLVAFLRDALTDPRVAWERAPFDHPSLEVPGGHIGDTRRVAGPANPKAPHRAQDINVKLPAVGASGRSSKQGPLQPFDAGLR